MRGKKRILSDEDLAHMRASFASGVGVTVLADVYQVSTSTIRLWMDPSTAEVKAKSKYRRHGPHLVCPRCPRCESVTRDGQMCDWCLQDKARIGF